MKKFKIKEDKENLVIKIYYDKLNWANLSKEEGKIVVNFCPHPNKDYWEFLLDDPVKILKKAEKQFLELVVTSISGCYQITSIHLKILKNLS